MINRHTRRDFIKGAAAPVIITSAALGDSRTLPASDRITLGFIGVGTRGGDGLITAFLKLNDCQCVATCDAFQDRRENWAGRIDAHYSQRAGAAYKSCAAYNDFRDLLARRDIDAVVIATPDHWHVPVAIAAVKAGKDIYVEKPLGLSIHQNRALRKAVRKHKRVFQYGTQQRSQRHLRFACELVRNGRIGKVHTIDVIAPAGSAGGSTARETVPEGFDYEMWLGPAPVKPYTRDRCIGFGRYFVYDYSIGYLGGWGAHPLDIAQWGNNTDDTSPVEYEGTGIIPTEGLFNTVTNWKCRCRYSNGVVMNFTDGPNLTKFIGQDGWVAVSRQSIDASPKTLLQSEIGPNEIHLHESANHYQDFLNGIRTRRPTVNPVESAIRSDAISHLCDIAIRTGRKIRWDPRNERILDDEGAEQMLSRPMRAPWRLS